VALKTGNSFLDKSPSHLIGTDAKKRRWIKGDWHFSRTFWWTLVLERIPRIEIFLIFFHKAFLFIIAELTTSTSTFSSLKRLTQFGGTFFKQKEP